MMRFRNEATENPELLLYGDIGESWYGEGNDPKEFAKTLMGIKAKSLTVRINSLGGDVFAGLAIYNSIRAWPGDVTVRIDGIAASAASVVAMAGKTVVMPSNSMMMVHNPWTYAMGYADDLRKTAETLDQIAELIVETYKGKTGLDSEKLKELMTAETWLSADEAKSYGFADSVDQLAVESKADAKNLIVCGHVFARANVKDADRVVAHMGSGKSNQPEERMDKDKLKAEFPDLYNEIRNEGAVEAKAAGATAERERIQAIENIAVPGFEDLVAKAKFSEPIAAEALGMKILAAQKERGTKFMQDRADDAAALDKVGQTEPGDQSKTDVDAATKAAFKAGYEKRGAK